ncbi:uncharacterized protein N7496_007704 [Penicillium cataractarum]|uniref:Uncharacterized protein n=1 Tax=Penicillium cataractarum TaxID=2100454 RepID=A0A9W9V507_9EURO|nr:uncharacterized protein N7496_007704 [Penicillium cataractarum]KAJ5367944.1 hypothetical protein N7496_007704 [Penicillium cataractarum]
MWTSVSIGTLVVIPIAGAAQQLNDGAHFGLIVFGGALYPSSTIVLASSRGICKDFGLVELIRLPIYDVVKTVAEASPWVQSYSQSDQQGDASTKLVEIRIPFNKFLSLGITENDEGFDHSNAKGPVPKYCQKESNVMIERSFVKQVVLANSKGIQ